MFEYTRALKDAPQALILIQVFVCIHYSFDILHDLLQTEMVMDMAFILKWLIKRLLNTNYWLRSEFVPIPTSECYSIQYVSLCLHVCVVYFYPTHTRTIHETQRFAWMSVCITVILLRMTHNESLLCTLPTKKERERESRKPKTKMIVFKFVLNCSCLCASVSANSLILNVATIEFSMSFNYLGFKFNTCQFDELISFPLRWRRIMLNAHIVHCTVV